LARVESVADYTGFDSSVKIIMSYIFIDRLRTIEYLMSVVEDENKIVF